MKRILSLIVSIIKAKSTNVMESAEKKLEFSEIKLNLSKANIENTVNDLLYTNTLLTKFISEENERIESSQAHISRANNLMEQNKRVIESLLDALAYVEGTDADN